MEKSCWVERAAFKWNLSKFGGKYFNGYINYPKSRLVGKSNRWSRNFHWKRCLRESLGNFRWDAVCGSRKYKLLTRFWQIDREMFEIDTCEMVWRIRRYTVCVLFKWILFGHGKKRPPNKVDHAYKQEFYTELGVGFLLINKEYNRECTVIIGVFGVVSVCVYI